MFILFRIIISLLFNVITLTGFIVIIKRLSKEKLKTHFQQCYFSLKEDEDFFYSTMIVNRHKQMLCFRFDVEEKQVKPKSLQFCYDNDISKLKSYGFFVNDKRCYFNIKTGYYLITVDWKNKDRDFYIF